MLTARENMLQTIRPGGKPDRFVKQYEAYDLIFENPIADPFPMPGAGPVVDSWGVTSEWAPGTPGPFPIHDQEHIVIQDIENWKDYVKRPSFKDLPEAAWEPAIAHAEAVDRNEKFCTVMIAPGLFERCHYLCEIKNTLEYLYEYPDEMHELIKYLTEFELEAAEAWIDHIHPDAVHHHDDWGMQTSTFMSPAMFADFFLEPYKEVYGYYKDHGVEIISHHSDSYGATLVPYMIEMGIDVWQGVLDTNNIPAMIEKYGGQIAFHGGMNNGIYDIENWSREAIHDGLVKLIESTDRCKYLIPGVCTGGPAAVFPGVYEAMDEEIEKLSAVYFQ